MTGILQVRVNAEANHMPLRKTDTLFTEASHMPFRKTDALFTEVNGLSSTEVQVLSYFRKMASKQRL